MGTLRWGPQTWVFFHTMAEKIKDECYEEIGPQLFMQIKSICRFLPCPECSQHATAFLSKVPPSTITTKEDFKQMLWFFHNVVNKKISKHLYENRILENYKNLNTLKAYCDFIKVYNTKGNMNLMAESFQRALVTKELSAWLKKNHLAFN